MTGGRVWAAILVAAVVCVGACAGEDPGDAADTSGSAGAATLWDAAEPLPGEPVPDAGLHDVGADVAIRDTAPDRPETVVLPDVPLTPPDVPIAPPDIALVEVTPPPGPVAIAVEEGTLVSPQTTLHLSADGDAAGALRVQWRVEQPSGSQGVFVPSDTFPSPAFEANVAGRYVFYLDAWDSWDADAEPLGETAVYAVQVTPESAIHVELLWTTEGDSDETDVGPFAGSDVDLHFVHPAAPGGDWEVDLDGDGAPDPYFDQPHDCYWFNPHPDWGAPGSEWDDDPGLDRDDTDGAGPENINLFAPEDGARYEVAVHYWNDHGYGASVATVRVYLHGVLAWEEVNPRLINYDLWCVAFIHWPSGTIEPCRDDDGSLHVTPNYQHPMFFEGRTDPCEACPPERPTCMNGACVECYFDSHCPAGQECDVRVYECVPETAPPDRCESAGCQSPYPGCVELNGVAVCVPCTEDAHCPGAGTCDVRNFQCEGVYVGCGDCVVEGCPSDVAGYDLACDPETGCCFDRRGLCDGVESFCDTASGSLCQPIGELIPGWQPGDPFLPDTPPGWNGGLCTCDAALATLCALLPDSPSCAAAPRCMNGLTCAPPSTILAGIAGSPPTAWVGDHCWSPAP